MPTELAIPRLARLGYLRLSSEAGRPGVEKRVSGGGGRYVRGGGAGAPRPRARRSRGRGGQGEQGKFEREGGVDKAEAGEGGGRDFAKCAGSFFTQAEARGAAGREK